MILLNKKARIIFLPCCVVLTALLFLSQVAYGQADTVKIGVLAYRGKDQAMRMWSPTAHYLSSRIPGHTFTIVPLNFQEMGPAVGSDAVDFVVTNTSFYVELESLYGVSRIATMQNKQNASFYTLFGGVIFCRADRHDIRDLRDLKGKKFVAVEETSLGGWQAAWREFKAAGINPYRDFSNLEFANTHDAVVYAVRDGTADAGTVRTDTLERMQDAGLIDLSIYRVLNEQHVPDFHYALSTRLYPEWPFAKLKDTSDDLSQDVAIALLQLGPGDPASKAAHITSWTIPLNYQPVHDLLKELRLGPYRDYGKMTLSGVMRAYWPWIILLALALIAATMTAGYVISLNHRLSAAHLQLRKHQDELEGTVLERTSQLRSMNEELEQEIANRTRTEAEKSKLQNQLFHIQKMEAVGVLAGGIAHDFNNILTAIIGFGHLISKRVEGDPQAKKYVENILFSSLRAAELIQGLLTFSRKQSIDPKPIDLVATVKSTENLLRELIGEKIDFRMDLPDTAMIVMADSGQIGQVLMNLVTNARDAMPDGGALTIAASVVVPDAEFFKTPPFRKPGTYAALMVTDSGTGMELAIQGRIFEPFFTTKSVGKGTGLGLAIVFGIVEQNDGYLLVDSRPGEGTTFTVYLPLHQAAV
jgi:signal transduction histidine kinase/ABC-type amino acid transport substrate-binding protein